MLTVGIKSLKNSLSQYLRMVKKGERVVVMDRNAIVAEIIPSTGNKEIDFLENYLKGEFSKGKILKAEKKTKLKLSKKSDFFSKDDFKIMKKIYHETRNDR